MSATTFPPSFHSLRSSRDRIGLAVAIALGAWLMLIIALGSIGAFARPPGKPPLGIAIGVAAPLAIFFVGLRLSQSFRAFVLALDLRLLAGMQAWRFAGLEFLALYTHKILPAVFALPAGLGDMAIGVTAPWIVLALLREPNFAASRRFVTWNVLGILDLAIALTIGSLSASLATGAPGEISTAPLATLPLLLIPGYLVPLFLMLHATALMQSRQMVRIHG
jgi:hypothetical protein